MITGPKFEESKSSGIHKDLLKMVGNWHGTAKVYFEPPVIADESPVTGTITPILDGRFLLHEYKGAMQGKSLSGLVIFGYDLNTQKFQSAWIDSYHNGTGIMFSESEKSPTNNSVLGSYSSGGDDPEIWGWRTEMEINGDDQLIIKAYNISPVGEEMIAVETIYNRKNF